MTSEMWKLKSGEGKVENERREGEGGQTHWLAAEEKSRKKRQRGEHQEIGLPAMSHLTFVYKRGDLISAYTLLFTSLRCSITWNLFTAPIMIS